MDVGLNLQSKWNHIILILEQKLISDVKKLDGNANILDVSLLDVIIDRATRAKRVSLFSLPVHQPGIKVYSLFS